MPIIQNKPIPACEVCVERVATLRVVLADGAIANVCGGCNILYGTQTIKKIQIELELKP